MHTIGNYVFDSSRLIIYKSDYKSVLSDLTKVNPDEMHMDKIAINNIGICLTYNCNLRCNYCGYSSAEQDKNNLI